MSSEAGVIVSDCGRETPEPASGLNPLWYGALFALSALFAFVEPAARPLAQLCMVPVLTLAMWKTAIRGVRVPRGVFVLMLMAVAGGALLRFSTVHLREGAFVVATVSKQELWQETRIYRDRLHRALGTEGRTLAGLHRGTIESQEAAASVLEKRPGLGGVVWGAPRWMSVTLRQVPALSLREFGIASFARQWSESNRWQDVRIVRSVSSTGLSHGHQDATVHFIADLIPLWSDFARDTLPGVDSSTLDSRLNSLSRTQARWSSRSHIAFVLWMLGTYHLIRAVEADTLGMGDLVCASREFNDALGQFRQKDNPELYAAIQNNLAIVGLIEADYAENRDLQRRRALKRMKVAQRVASGVGQKDIVRNAGTLGLSLGRRGNDSKK